VGGGIKKCPMCGSDGDDMGGGSPSIVVTIVVSIIDKESIYESL